MSEKPAALRLADELDVASLGIRGCLEALSAAALRLQHAGNMGLLADNERLRAENERLRDELRQSGIDHTRAENERLREALKSIAANACCDRCQEAALVAKAALKEPPR